MHYPHSYETLLVAGDTNNLLRQLQSPVVLKYEHYMVEYRYNYAASDSSVNVFFSLLIHLGGHHYE